MSTKQHGLSVIVACNYTHPYFLDIVEVCLRKNLQDYRRLCESVEIVFVDWNTKDINFKDHPQLSSLMSDEIFKHIRVDESVILAENLNPNLFYEFFAKNVGIRHCSYDKILLTEPDVVLESEELLYLYNQIASLENGTFFRPARRANIKLPPRFIEQELRWNLRAVPENTQTVIDILEHPLDFVSPSTCFSAEFLIGTTHDIVHHGRGYDELEPIHRSHVNQQAHMDGEIIFNLGLNVGPDPNKCQKMIDVTTYHIDHGKINDDNTVDSTYGSRISRESFYNQKGYSNKPNWGFIDYNIKQENNLMMITT